MKSPLLRGDFKWTIIMFLVGCFTFGFSCLVFPFFYNKIYIKAKLMSGYKPSDEGSRDIFIVHDKTNNLLKFKDVLKWKDIVEN